MDGAKITSPQKPMFWNIDIPKTEIQKEMVEKIIALFAESNITYDECKKILEATNETLQYKSRFVRLLVAGLA